MKSTEFKIGDKVKFISEGDSSLSHGAIGIITRVYLDSAVVEFEAHGVYACDIEEIELYNKPQKIKIKYHYPDQPRLEKITKGTWVDMYTSEDVWIEPFKRTMINLGVSMQLPEGYEANIVPRSSTFKNFNLIQTNHYGVIDDTYQGNDDIWHMPVIYIPDAYQKQLSEWDYDGNISFSNDLHFPSDSNFIPKHTRLCQFRINEIQPDIEFEEVEFLDGENRGGFGSTGR